MYLREEHEGFATHRTRGKVPVIDDSGWNGTGLGTVAILAEIFGCEVAQETEGDANGCRALLAGVVLRPHACEQIK